MKKLILIIEIFSVLFPTYSYSACNIINGKAYGDYAGVTVNYGSKGNIKVSSYVSESGIIEGARILPGGTLFLSGICNGDIVVSKSGKVTVTGSVNGTIINNGGTVEIEGDVSAVVANYGSTTISGTVAHITGKGKVSYRKGAVIGGKPVE